MQSFPVHGESARKHKNKPPENATSFSCTRKISSSWGQLENTHLQRTGNDETDLRMLFISRCVSQSRSRHVLGLTSTTFLRMIEYWHMLRLFCQNQTLASVCTCTEQFDDVMISGENGFYFHERLEIHAVELVYFIFWGRLKTCPVQQLVKQNFVSW